jgi:hypothetical protein
MNLTAYHLLIEFSLEDLTAKLQATSVTPHPYKFARLAGFIEKLSRLFVAVDDAWNVRSEEPAKEHWECIKNRVQDLLGEYGSAIYDYDRKLNVVVRDLLFLTFDKLGVPEEERGFAG